MYSRLRTYMVVVILLMASSLMPVSADSGDISLFGQSLVIRSGERIAGNASVVGGSAEIQAGGTLTGDLAVVGGNVRIAGTVEGAVVVIGGKLELDGTARIVGDLVAMGEFVRDPDAQVIGNVVAGAEATGRMAQLGSALRGDLGATPPLIDRASESAPVLTLKRILGWIGGLMVLLVIGVVAAFVFPGPIDHMGDVMSRSSMLCLGMGVLTLVAASILMPLLTIIIVGIPVVMVLGVALALGCLLGWIASAAVVGDRVVRATSGFGRGGRVAVGIVLLTLIGRIPCLGGLATLLAVCWGLGSVVLTRFGTSEERIWAPFASLAGDAAASAAPQSPPEKPAYPSPAASHTEAATVEPTAKDDTRPLDDSDLDSEMDEYTG